MADTTIGGLGTKAAPLDYKIPKTLEVFPRSIKATFDGSGAGASFLPTLQVIADSGDVVGTYPVDTAVAAGASADVSWFPRSVAKAGATPASAVIGACAGITATVTTPVGPVDYHIVYDTLVYDTSGGAMWTAGAPTLMTAPSSGLYLLVCTVDIFSAAAEEVKVIIFSNAPPGSAAVGLPNANVSRPNATVSCVYNMTTGQTVFTQLTYTGNALSQYGRFGVNNYRNFLTMTKLA